MGREGEPTKSWNNTGPASAAGSARTFCLTWRCQPPSPSQGRRLLCIEQQGDTVSSTMNGLITQNTAHVYSSFPCRGHVLSVTFTTNALPQHLEPGSVAH